MVDGCRTLATTERLEPTLDAPGEARDWLHGTIAESVPAVVVPDALLLVSELVSNSVLHAGPTDAIELAAHLSGDAVRVEVRDDGAGFEPPSSITCPSPRQFDGRGLYLVDRLASRWGASVEDGTCVWFELTLTRS